MLLTFATVYTTCAKIKNVYVSTCLDLFSNVLNNVSNLLVFKHNSVLLIYCLKDVYSPYR